MPALLERYPRKPGRPVVRALLERTEAVPRQAFAAAFLALLHRHGLPRPTLSVLIRAGGRVHECDCVWHDARLMVELDGRAFHDRSGAFERDRERDRILTAAGRRVLRVTWRGLATAPEALAADLRALLK